MNIPGLRKSIKPQPQKFSTITVRSEKKAMPLPSKVQSEKRQNAQNSQNKPMQALPSRSGSAISSTSPRDHLRPPVTKRKSSRSKSPVHRFESSSDSESDDMFGDRASPAKRQRLDRQTDFKRRLRSKEAFSEADGGVFEMIHAADLISDTQKSKPLPDIVVENVTVKLQYPSASQCERFDLVFGRDQINAVEDIIKTAKIVTNVYMIDEQKSAFDDPNTGFIRQLEKTRYYLLKDIKSQKSKERLNDFKDAVEKYNGALNSLIKAGSVAKNIDSLHQLPLDMIEFILQQVYDRVVSPKVETLLTYKNGEDNVYGELRPKFVSRVLSQAGLQSDHLFVDLGSGVGNVVLQAALEFGCESWGCEMMPNACTLADAQKREFAARCRLWGIQSGEVHLKKGSFLGHEKIRGALGKADVVLVNNQAFTSELNHALVELFLDLKDGCKIISLRSFVPPGYQRNSRNEGNPLNNLIEVVEGEFFNGDVSWTSSGGSYCMATKRARASTE